MQFLSSSVFTCMKPWAPRAERGPSLESIYRVSLTVDLCKGNKIISLKNYFTTASWGPLKKKKKSGGPGHVPSVPIGYGTALAFCAPCVGQQKDECLIS